MPRGLIRAGRFGLIFLSAVLLVLPYHFPFLWPLAFVAFVPYFAVLDTQTPARAFRVSYLFGFLFFCFLGFWLTLVNVLGFLVLAAYLALYFAFFGMAASYFLNPSVETDRTNLSKHLKTLLFVPAFWVVSEYLRGWIISGLPWSLLAYSQWKNLPFIQIADWTGAYGVSYAVLLVNLLLFKLTQKKFMRPLAAILAAVFVLCYGYGGWVLSRSGGAGKGALAAPGVRVSVVQGNIPQDQKWDTKIKNLVFEKYRRLTDMSAAENPDLIVWPETSFPGYLENETLMAAQLRGLVKKARTYVLVGAPTIGDLEKGLRFYNSAILYDARGEEVRRYHKVHLVPFGEYIPFDSILGFIRNFFPIGRFSPGKEKTIFSVPYRSDGKEREARFGVLICYEDIFPGLVRDFCAGGADFLINMTNDAWFGKTSAPYQHAQASVFRAVENRIPVVRSTNTGLSCFITPEGRIAAVVEDKGREIFVTGHRTQEILLEGRTSFYRRYGDVFAVMAFLISFMAYRERGRRQVYSRV